MPIYEFQCINCCSKFEVLIRSKNDEIFCPHCQTSEIDRLPSIFGFKSNSGFDISPQRTRKSCSSCSKASCTTCY